MFICWNEFLRFTFDKQTIFEIIGLQKNLHNGFRHARKLGLLGKKYLEAAAL